MPAETAVLELSESYALGLDPPFSPSICLSCFTNFVSELNAGSSALQLLQMRGHSLWNRIISFISAEWTPDRRVSVSDILRRSFFRCQCRPRYSRVKLDLAEDYLGLALGLTCEALQLCMSNRIGGQTKGFLSRRGRWPTSVEQLFPYGPEQTIRSLVDLLDLYPKPAGVIAGLLSIHRPLTFPVLLESETRARLISATVGRFVMAATAANVALARIRQPVIPAVQEAIALSQIKRCSSLILLLFVLACGVDSEPADYRRVIAQHELSLFKPLDALLFLFTDTQNAGIPAETVGALLWQSLSQSQRETLGFDAPPQYAGANYAPSETVLEDPYIAVHFYLPQRLDYRGCCGPACGRQVHSKTAPGAFARCARCNAVQYCSRACQKADWTRDGPFAHRELCDMLHELRTAASLDMDATEFADACRARCVPLDRVARLIAWAKDRPDEHEHGDAHKDGVFFRLSSETALHTE